jgi:uncharacterized protein
MARNNKIIYIITLLLLIGLMDTSNAVNDDGEDDDDEVIDPPIIAFAKIGNYDAVKTLIHEAKDEGEKEKVLNVLDHKDRSALTWALRRHKPRVAHLLIDEGIDVMHMDCQNHTSLWWALHRHEPEIALKLIENGVDVNTDRQHTYLYTVAMYGYEKIATALIERGADLDQRNIRGLTAIDIARQNRRMKVVDALERAMVKRKNAFELACLHNHKFVVDELLELNPEYEFDSITMDGKTGIQWSKLKGNHDISKKLTKILKERKEKEKNDL